MTFLGVLKHSLHDMVGLLRLAATHPHSHSLTHPLPRDEEEHNTGDEHEKTHGLR